MAMSMEQAPSIPPTMSSTDRGGPGMSESPRSADMIRKLAERKQGGQGGGAEHQSAQLLMQGTQMLMQAAQLNPQLAPIIERVRQTLVAGVQQLAGGVGGGPPPTPPQEKKRSKKKPSPEDEGGGGEGMGGGYPS